MMQADETILTLPTIDTNDQKNQDDANSNKGYATEDKLKVKYLKHKTVKDLYEMVDEWDIPDWTSGNGGGSSHDGTSDDNVAIGKIVDGLQGKASMSYHYDRDFVKRLMDDEWLQGLLTNLRDPMECLEFDDISDLPGHTHSAVLTLNAVYVNRYNHVRALFSILKVVYKRIASDARLIDATFVLADKIDALRGLIPNVEAFGAVASDADNLKRCFEEFIKYNLAGKWIPEACRRPK